MKTASARLPTVPIWPDVVPADATDYAALHLQSVRRRGSGIALRSRPSTSGRMTRVLKIMGIAPSKHGAWCGMGLKEWLKTNPSWSESEWVTLVAENFDAIQEAA